MSTRITGCTNTLGQAFRIETLGTTKGGMKRLKHLLEASGQLGLTTTRIARAASCPVEEAKRCVEELAAVGAVKPRHNTIRTYAINPHYKGNIWCTRFVHVAATRQHVAIQPTIASE